MTAGSTSKRYGKPCVPTLQFRFRSSGIRNQIYLVEKRDDCDFAQLGADRFQAALMQTQINDGLFLRCTSTLEDTIKFLVALHAEITRRYAETPITGAVKSVPFDKRAYLQDKPASAMMTFGCFSFVNSKSAALKLRDLFMKQLMVVQKLSAEKAAMIADRFPTPLLLQRHYQSLPSEEACEDYFSEWKAKGQEKVFGKALSQRIYHIFCRQETPL